MLIPRQRRRGVGPRVDSCLCRNPAQSLYRCPLSIVSFIHFLAQAQRNLQSRNGLTDTSTWPMYVCALDQHCRPGCIAKLARAQRTYISAFSKRFFRLSLIASFDILLMSVRSETPTSFFLVLSKAAFRTWGFPPPLFAVCALPGSFLRPARFVTACRSSKLVQFNGHIPKASSYHIWFLWTLRSSCVRAYCGRRARELQRID